MNESDAIFKKKVHDCLVGGAMGDALGYTVEFLSYAQIVQKFGSAGICDFQLNSKGIAEISDDTQMTLFTAASALMGLTRGYARGVGGAPAHYVRYGYMDWYHTQVWDSWHEGERRDTWLMDVKELYSRRAPGITCLNSIESILNREEPKNDSCGCGGVMRTAPLAAIYAKHNIGIDENDMDAAHTAAVTHKHHLGYIPAAILNHILYDIFTSEREKSLEQVVLDAISYFETSPLNWSSRHLDSTSEQFKRRMGVQIDLLKSAVRLAKSEQEDVTCIHELGGGWTGHEALAIAIFCAVRYPDDIDKSLIAAVNHSGDSDSTGSIAGQIVGAYSGIENSRISIQKLELLDVIEEIAEDCANKCPMKYFSNDTEEEGVWEKKYIYMKRYSSNGKHE